MIVFRLPADPPPDLVDLHPMPISAPKTAKHTESAERHALDKNDHAELPIVAASGLPSRLRVNMPISA
jgi:hypothetical protein